MLFLNDDGMGDPLPFMRSRVDAGVEVVVCTAGGVRGHRRDRRRASCTSRHSRVDDVVDTNGAGDAFLSGFLVSRLAGAGLEECLRAGHAQAARTLRVPDARSPARLGVRG